MPWRTEPIGPDSFVIMTEDGVVVGSIKLDDGAWNVEILWNGPSGDYHFKSAYFPPCVAFIEGVEAAQRKAAEGCIPDAEGA